MAIIREKKEGQNDDEKKEEVQLDYALRPKSLDYFIGQETLKKNLSIILRASKKRSESAPHLLFYGPPGLGKTTLAGIVAAEMGGNLKISSGPAIEKAGDLAAILTNLNEGDVLFIDEIHRLRRPIEEILYSAMEDFALDIITGKGPGARSMRLPLKHFTLVAATTRLGDLSSPLRDRFGEMLRLDFYTPEELVQILSVNAKKLEITLEKRVAKRIAERSRGTPRISNRLLKRLRDFTHVQGEPSLSLALAEEALSLMGVDALGLTDADRFFLQVLAEKFSGGPVGLSTLAAATFEGRETIEDIREPFLLQLGFLARTPKGRILTPAAFEHMGIPQKEEKKTTLF
jgi:Holliday junction DNA helicase RuvB